ncbi:Tubulin-specific chaperone D-like protein [Dinothrombium tinctorium]|uniref:Tubulin-specific chaperone D n=1 Tax=Dinothrombium tinctorium TaxID=1965070 RepID=A0A443RQU6_9ACAR|nr:Tubulin-specific chaperone D-like protein [Dinothrombium tinctorium]RWS17629.1 Tubulin-specific chaperone D-like protein [Dinothrombium tinctorium]
MDCDEKIHFYEHFVDREAIDKLIDAIAAIERDHDCERIAEGLCEKMKTKLDAYQEQPHLLDAHIPSFFERLLKYVRLAKAESDDKLSSLKYHLSFKLLYSIIKVRGFKTAVRYFPHQVTDIEPVLAMLANQSPKDVTNWETTYVLLLWMSIIIMVPFHLNKFDPMDGDNIPVMLRLVIYIMILNFINSLFFSIFNLIKLYLPVYGKCNQASAFLAARFLTRPEITKMYLSSFIDWCIPFLDEAVEDQFRLNSTVGPLLALAYTFKIGEREALIPYGTLILEKIRALNLKQQKHEYYVKLVVKLTQRLGLCFLKKRVALWRYSRGKRCLADNLASNFNNCDNVNIETSFDDEIDDSHIEEIETVVEILLTALKHEFTLVRWSAAKGIGRLSERLSHDMAKEIVENIWELFTYQETDSTWNGACLALAEMSRRGLILPEDLPKIIDVVMSALVYDESKGSFSVGAHVRDAACYVCWSFARAYDKNVMFPFVKEIAINLLIVALFDREVNCRRAASAAFQENVGRQGNFPNGIEIVTTVDYQAVGSRTSSYLELSVFVAKFPIYTKPLILHLVNRKVHHWDPVIRELTAEALHNLSLIASSEFIISEIIPKLISNFSSLDFNLKHGSIISFSFIIHALYLKGIEMPENVLNAIIDLSLDVDGKNSLRGVGGEYMKHALSLLIEKSSLSKLNLKDNLSLINIWTKALKETIQYVDSRIRDHGLKALKPFCDFYLNGDRVMQDKLIAYFLSQIRVGEEHSRCGALNALQQIPDSMFEPDTPSIIINSLLNFLLNIAPEEEKMTEAKAAAIRCTATTLIRLDPTLLFTLKDPLKEVFSYLLSKGMEDYTEGSKGDIGLITRIAAIESTKFSRNGLCETLESLKQTQPSTFECICRTFLEVFHDNLSNERLCQPLIATFDFIISTGLLDDFDENLIKEALSLCWACVRNSADLKKLIAAGNLFCNSLRFKGCPRTFLTST